MRGKHASATAERSKAEAQNARALAESERRVASAALREVQALEAEVQRLSGLVATAERELGAAVVAAVQEERRLRQEERDHARMLLRRVLDALVVHEPNPHIIETANDMALLRLVMPELAEGSMSRLARRNLEHGKRIKGRLIEADGADVPLKIAEADLARRYELERKMRARHE